MQQNKIRIYIHFVWGTWDRLPMIPDELERDLYRYIESVCQDDDCKALAVNGMTDQVHLLAALSNTISASDLMHHVKGGSSRFLSERLKSKRRFNGNEDMALTASVHGMLNE